MSAGYDEESVRHPHDGLVKRVFTDPEAAAVELRQVLPAALCDQLDWSSLEVSASSFIDPQLRPRHSDILYSVALRRTGQRISVYVVLEHQSTPDPMMAARFLVYVGRLYERFLRDDDGSGTVPMVVPVLLYQGPRGWTLPRRLSEILDIPPELLEAISPPVELTFAVDDLQRSLLGEQVTRDQLVRERGLALAEMARSMLWLAFHPEASRGARAAVLGPLLDFVAETYGPSEVQPFLTYFVSAFERNSPLRATIVESLSQETRSMFISIRDEWLAQGKAQGRAQGMAQGRAQGLAQALERLLVAKGLELTAEQRERVAACTDEARLQAWFDRAVTATAPAQVFEA